MADDSPGVRPRVLIIAPSERLVGGQAQQAALLTKRLRESGQVDVAFLSIDRRLPPWVTRVPVLRTLVNEMAFLAALLPAVASVDVVHVFSASYWSFLLHPVPALAIARLLGKASLLNYHSGEAADHLARFRLTAVPTMRALPDKIIVPSGYLRDVFSRHALVAEEIGNVIDIDSLPFRKRRALQPKFLANRALEPLYNVDCIIKAFAIIQRARADASLVIAGDGSQRPRLEQLCRELNLRNVVFLGRLEPRKMLQLYESVDIYLNSPHIDNMPVSLVECGAAGLPIVTTRTGGIPYMVKDGETALLVDEDDAEGLARASLQLLDDEQLAERLSTAGRALVESKNTWNAVSQRWISTYCELSRAVPQVARA